MALLLTFLSGLFFLIGIIIYKYAKNRVELINMAYGCALVVVIGLIVTDLVPELLEIGSWWNIFFVAIGIGAFILIDKLIPHHHHEHHENDEEDEDHKHHLEHISIITIIALILHNIVEGASLYSVASTDLKGGILMLIGIGLHNLPFGFQISAMRNDLKNKGLIFLLVISGLIGGLIVFICGTITGFIEGIIISLTMGMLIHICIFELFNEVLQNIKKKNTIYGIIIGIIILIIINVI